MVLTSLCITTKSEFLQLFTCPPIKEMTYKSFDFVASQSQDSSIKLLDYVPGERCPIEARLHGTENLLHRACVAGNALVGFSNVLQYAIIIFMIPISGGT